ncbi:hypothetical protein CMV_004944 [Castanea mollissima]|uniref:Uncharacterized protein n=1 Tax=Castanea mollissima TaxID=60419 RepID=A0A8J4RTL1_9ROSI|nr:hypothetical protein CMV_004944 [Castanea mollissima]
MDGGGCELNIQVSMHVIFYNKQQGRTVNGITKDSFSDVCGRSAVPLYCNFSGASDQGQRQHGVIHS